MILVGCTPHLTVNIIAFSNESNTVGHLVYLRKRKNTTFGISMIKMYGLFIP